MEELTVEELRAYLEALQSATYVPGRGFRVQTPDGQTVIMSADEVNATRADVDRRIADMTTNVLEAVGGAVASGARAAAKSLTEPAATPPTRAEQIVSGQKQVSKAVQKLVDDVLNARSKRDNTALQLIGQAPSQGEKSQADLTRWEQKVVAAESALAKRGLMVDEQGSLRTTEKRESAPSSARLGPPAAVTTRRPPADVATGERQPDGVGSETVVAPAAGGRAPVSVTADMRDRALGTNVAPAGVAAEPRRNAAPAVTTPGVRRAQPRRVQEQAWMTEFQRLYPAYKEWTTDAVVQHFGQDFVDLIKSVASGEVEYTEESFQAALFNTQYGMRTNRNQIEFDRMRPADQQDLVRVTADEIRRIYGDVEFTESQITELARVAARSGLSGVGLRQEVYRSAFRMSEGQEVPVLRMQALRGEDADRINRVARAYGRKATDAEIRSILTGEPLNGVVLTEEGLTQRLQAEAKALFPQFADQIDAGVTLETIGDRYKKYAADLLEMPEDNIDMFSGPYLKAFGDREKGPLSLFEWQQTVKSDPTFGWQYTKQANDQATSLGLAMARAFGAIQ